MSSEPYDGLFVKTDPDRDERFLELGELCVKGELPMYFADAPMSAIVPFDFDYRPDRLKTHSAAMKVEEQEMLAHGLRPMIVYQRGIWLVVSDDYLRLFTLIFGGAEKVPLWLIGEPNSPFVNVIDGPLPLEKVREVFFGK